jgi:hypothetical protein
MRKILLYATEAEAIEALEHLEHVARQLWSAEGYTINDDGEVVAKNAVTREDILNATTNAWDIIHAYPDGGYYFASTNNNPAYVPYFNQLVTGNYTEIEYEPPVAETTEE